MTLNANALKMLRQSQKVSLELDGETHRLLQELAASAGYDVPTLLNRLAQRYTRANYFERQIVLGFLKKEV